MTQIAEEAKIKLIYLRPVSADFFERLCYNCDEIRDAEVISEDKVIIECYAQRCLFTCQNKMREIIKLRRCLIES